MSSPPKSCLKRNSFPTTTRPRHLDGARAERPGAVFEPERDWRDRSAPPSFRSPFDPSSAAPRERRKSVSFCEDDDVRVFYPVTDPLSKQARKQVVRIFKACAEALRIDSSDSPSSSRRGSASSIEEEDEDER
ncbi:hypothetical protein BD414DRAFT_537111 [Trametes punicea]|nr:hypothetical protein BD414DRAFT_537111 [Trametes punicea]